MEAVIRLVRLREADRPNDYRYFDGTDLNAVYLMVHPWRKDAKRMEVEALGMLSDNQLRARLNKATELGKLYKVPTRFRKGASYLTPERYAERREWEDKKKNEEEDFKNRVEAIRRVIPVDRSSLRYGRATVEVTLEDLEALIEKTKS